MPLGDTYHAGRQKVYYVQHIFQLYLSTYICLPIRYTGARPFLSEPIPRDGKYITSNIFPNCMQVHMSTTHVYQNKSCFNVRYPADPGRRGTIGPENGKDGH